MCVCVCVCARLLPVTPYQATSLSTHLQIQKVGRPPPIALVLRQLTAPASTDSNPNMASMASFKIPEIDNEPMVGSADGPCCLGADSDALQRNYAPGSAERTGLEAALKKMQSQMPFEVPCVVDGKEVRMPLSSSQIRTDVP